MSVTAYHAIIFVGIVVTLLSGLRQLRYLQTAIARWSAVLLFGISLQLISYSLLIMDTFPGQTRLLFFLQVGFYLTIDVSYLVFTLYFSGHANWVNWRTIAGVLFLSFLILGFFLANWDVLPKVPDAYHTSLGPLFAEGLPDVVGVLFLGFSFFVGIAVIALLVMMFPNANQFIRRTVIVLLLGSLLIVSGGVLEMLFSDRLQPVSPLQVAISLNAISILLVVVSWGTSNFIPFGRRAFIDTIQDGYLILDSRDRVVDCNPAIYRILDSHIQIGETFRLEDYGLGAFLNIHSHRYGKNDPETSIVTSLQGKPYEIKQVLVGSQVHEDRGRTIIFHHISSLENVESELQQKNIELERANAYLTTLSNVTIDLQNTINTETVFEVLGRELRGLGLNSFIALYEPGQDELSIRYLSHEKRFVRIMEKIVHSKAVGYKLSRDTFNALYHHLNTRQICFFSDKASSLSAFFGDGSNWIRDGLEKYNVIARDEPSMVIPLIANNVIIGMVSVWGRNLMEVDVAPFQLFGSQLAWTIEKARLYESENRRAEDLEHSSSLISALSRVSSMLDTTRNSDVILDTLGSELQKIDLKCAVVTLDESKEIATIQYLSLQSGLINLIEQVLRTPLKDYQIHRNLWPGVKSVEEKKPTWYANPAEIFTRMFSKLPKVAVNKAHQLMEYGSDDQLCFLPLIAQDDVIGVMPIWGTNLKQSDTPALTVFGNQVASILVSARSYEAEVERSLDLTRSNNFITALSNVAAQLDDILDFPKLLNTLGQEFKKLGLNAMIGLFDDPQQNMKIEFMSNGHNYRKLPSAVRRLWPKEINVPRRLWPTDEILVEKKPYWDPKPLREISKMFPHIPQHMFEETMTMLGFDLTAPLCYFPMIVDEKVIGVLAAWGMGFRQVDIPAMSAFANQLAIALKNTNLYNQAQNEIAERIEVERQIRDMLEEKEVLLKEVHHRVKNNLQVISSLLNLQALQADDNIITNALRESQSRVRSMALIHEKLYQSEDLAQVAFDTYLHSLTQSLIQTYQVPSQKVSVKIEAKDIFFDIDTAIPCGLIVNELMTNSLKYAFPDDRAGTITVSCQPDLDQGFTLSVSDDGRGIPADVDIQKPFSLGLKLVHSLVRQIRGSIEVQNQVGTKINIWVPSNL